MRPFSRLRRITAEELSWRARVTTRTHLERLRMRMRPPRWDRRDLQHVLNPDVVRGALRDAIAEGDWPMAHAILADLIRMRPARFPLDPVSSSALRMEVLAQWPGAASQAASRADRIVTGHYDVLGYRGLRFADADGAVDWHFDPVHNRRAPRSFWADVPYLDPAIGDHKIIWELNRHQHWLQLGRAFWLTGDSRYATTIVEQLSSWLEENPPLWGINWASMLEIGFRTISWTWALHCLLADPGSGIPDPGSGIGTPALGSGPRVPDPGSRIPDPWILDLLLGLDRQLTHLHRNLSRYFSPNTHLTGEALALYVTGVALPELAASDQRASTGREILLQEIDRQIGADGGHAERSTHYHRYTLDFYLLALLTAIRTNDTEAMTRFADAVNRLSEFARAMADDRGRLPLIGDDDGGMLWPLTGRECNDVRDSLALAAVLIARPDLAPWGVTEEVFWIAGQEGRCRGGAYAASTLVGGNNAPTATSRALADTGYWVSRDGRGGHLVFDVGEHGYLNGGHAHADALAITLSINGRPVLVDPGTSTYTMDRRLRDRLRSTMSHNTVVIDGRPQSIPDGPFHWRTRTNAHLRAWRSNQAFDWVEASHLGYPGVRHRRSIVRTGAQGWLIVDEVLGHGLHAATTYWHFDPDWMISSSAPGRLRATHCDGDIVWLLHDGGDVQLVHGDEQSGLGWCAPAYGTLVPTWTSRIARQAVAPFSMLTWIGAAGDSTDPPTLQRLSVDSDHDDAHAMAARVITGSRVSTVMLRPGVALPRAATIVDYQTNARVLHYVACDNRLLALDIVDGSHALSLRGGWLSVAADNRLADFHVGLNDGTLQLLASTPPALLRLQGEAVTRPDKILLNGRETPASVLESADTVLLLASHWGDREKYVVSGFLSATADRESGPPGQHWLVGSQKRPDRGEGG